MSESREQFEAWMQANWPRQYLGRFATGEYRGYMVEHCWRAWQASRLFLVEQIKGLEAAGVRVKP